MSFETGEAVRAALQTKQTDLGPGGVGSIPFESFTQVDGTSSTDFLTMDHEGELTGPTAENVYNRMNLVRADKLTAFYVRQGLTVPFSFNTQHIFQQYDMFLQMLYGSAWTASFSLTATDLTFAAAVPPAGSTITSATPGVFSALAAELPCPIWITTPGGTGPALDTMVIAQGVDAPGTILTIGGGTADVADDFGLDLGTVVSGDSVTIAHDGGLVFGTIVYSAHVEKFQPKNGHYKSGYGLVCSSFQKTTANNSFLTTSWNFMGRKKESFTATQGTGTEVAAATFAPFETGSQVQFFGIGGEFSTILDPAVSTADLGFTTFDTTITVAPISADLVGLTGPHEHERGSFIEEGNLTLLDNAAALAIEQIADDGEDGTAKGRVSMFHANLKRETGTTMNAYAEWNPQLKLGVASAGGGANDGASLTPITTMAEIDARTATIGATKQGGFMKKYYRFFNQPINALP